MQKRYLLLIVLAIITFTQSKSRTKTFPWSKIEQKVFSTNEQVSYQELYYTQKVSHFNFKLTGKTWHQRYLIDLSNWSKSLKGPILMYCGNEGPIEMFYKNTGWYNDYVTK